MVYENDLGYSGLATLARSLQFAESGQAMLSGGMATSVSYYRPPPRLEAIARIFADCATYRQLMALFSQVAIDAPLHVPRWSRIRA